MHLVSLTNAIECGIKRLSKYYPKSPRSLGIMKPFLIRVLLDPGLKARHFQPSRALCFYAGIDADVKGLLREEFSK